jgi:hypothetical protein
MLLIYSKKKLTDYFSFQEGEQKAFGFSCSYYFFLEIVRKEWTDFLVMRQLFSLFDIRRPDYLFLSKMAPLFK